MISRKPTWSSSYKPQSGFTFLELLLVLAVMAIVVTIAYPNLTNIVDSIRLRNDALLLAQELRAARTEAIMSQEARDIRFYQNTNHYELSPANRVIYLSQGIRIQGNTFNNDPYFYVPYCRFRATGSPSQGGHVKLVNRQGKVKHVIVSVVMGRVRVSDYPPGSNELTN